MKFYAKHKGYWTAAIGILVAMWLYVAISTDRSHVDRTEPMLVVIPGTSAVIKKTGANAEDMTVQVSGFDRCSEVVDKLDGEGCVSLNGDRARVRYRTSTGAIDEYWTLTRAQTKNPPYHQILVSRSNGDQVVFP